jgi:hypothetical protein
MKREHQFATFSLTTTTTPGDTITPLKREGERANNDPKQLYFPILFRADNTGLGIRVEPKHGEN